MGFSRQECWSGLPFPSPGDLPDPGLEPGSRTLQADTLPSEPPGKLLYTGCGKQQIFSSHSSLGNPRPRCQHIQCLVRAYFLIHRDFLCNVSLFEVEGTEPDLCTLISKGINQIREDSTLMTYSPSEGLISKYHYIEG